VPRGTSGAVVDHLSVAFAAATRTTMLAGAAFLAIGFAATLRLSRRTPSTVDAEESAQ
jgi:HAMP domain-containing protein